MSYSFPPSSFRQSYIQNVSFNLTFLLKPSITAFNSILRNILECWSPLRRTFPLEAALSTCAFLISLTYNNWTMGSPVVSTGLQRHGCRLKVRPLGVERFLFFPRSKVSLHYSEEEVKIQFIYFLHDEHRKYT